MYQASVNKKTSFTLKPIESKNNAFEVNDLEISCDFLKASDKCIYTTIDGESFKVDILDVCRENKKATLFINGSSYVVELMDKFDLLLKNLGMDSQSSGQVKELAAPMPGLVLDVLVNSGQEVVKDEELLILQAMKMENVIKSPTSGIIKSINISKDESVDKNQVLINFE